MILAKTQQLLNPFLEERPTTLAPAKFVQLVILRQTTDFTVLRTEASRELNSVLTPKSIVNHEPTLRVAFFGTKQKAVETRNYASIFRELKKTYEVDTTTIKELLSQTALDLPPEEVNASIDGCRLKDNLCLKCPRCILFGGITVQRGEREASLKHRINYSTAYSLESYEEVATAITFNAVYEEAEVTGKALGTIYAVDPITNFPSIVTLRAPTIRELTLYVKTLEVTADYGAETRVRGRVRNHVVGIASGMQELITPLELTLELADRRKDFESTPENLTQMIYDIMLRYKKAASFGTTAKVLTPNELRDVLYEIQSTVVDKEFIKAILLDSLRFHKDAREALQRIRAEEE